MNIRKYLHSQEYEKDKKLKLPLPVWLHRLITFLTNEGLDKGSVDTYAKCIPFVWLAIQKTY